MQAGNYDKSVTHVLHNNIEVNRNTCIQVPRFFSEEKISGLRWELNPHLHISGVMLYQLSYQALLGARWWE